MSKSIQDGDDIAEPASEPQNASDPSQQFFFPPQDGRDAFVCEAQNQTEANALYAAAPSEK